jgi:hypothetical protein
MTIKFLRLVFLQVLIATLLSAPAALAVTYTLTVNTSGSGSFNQNPSNSVYPSGVTVTATATPNSGWYFSGWSGDVAGTINPTNVLMNANKVMTANFLAYPTYALTLTTNGQGGISLSPPGFNYPSNTVVTATATPASGWIFTSWSGSTNTSANPVSVTMNANSSLTATFVQPPAFDIQPSSVSTGIGSTVNFTPHAVGAAPLKYQWFFANGPLAGATNATLSLANVQLANAGYYWIVATNSYGSATSSVAALVLTNSGGSANAVSVCTEASLRAAINAGGWVSINCNGTITLSNTISINSNVILDAKNVSMTINGGNAVRLFYVAPGVSFTATNLTLANGYVTGSPADGAAIYDDGGIVKLVSSTLVNNQTLASYGALARGGAIFNKNGSLSLYSCSISSNAANGGIVGSSIGTGLGGAIYSTNGSVLIAGCNLSNNSSLDVDGAGSLGGAFYQATGSLIVTNSLFTGNTAKGGPEPGSFSTYASPAYGGALAATAGGSIAVDHCQFFGNSATGGGGRYTGAGYGGAIYSASSLTAESSTFAGNQALSGDLAKANPTDGQGGAIYSSGSAVFNHCSAYSNYVRGAAGLSSFVGGTGGNGLGGGIFNASQLKATNCTIALNSATAGSGTYFNGSRGANGNALGGGIYNSINATSILVNVTIASNFCLANGPSFSGTNGFSAGSQIVNTNGSVHLLNSLLAYAGTNGNVWGSAIADDGFNFSSDGSAGFSSGSSFNFTDPQLAPLGNNGGPTLTMALLDVSPAIDYATSTGAPITDQRGFFRPVGSSPDVGAYEFGSYVFSAPVLNIVCLTNYAVISYTAYPSNYYRLQSSTNLTSWTDLSTNGWFSSPTNVIQSINQQGWKQRFFRVRLQ